jgi:hypothetical protein
VVDNDDAASGNRAGKPNRTPGGCSHQGSDTCSQVHTSMTRIPALNRWIESPRNVGPPVKWPNSQSRKSRQRRRAGGGRDDRHQDHADED